MGGRGQQSSRKSFTNRASLSEHRDLIISKHLTHKARTLANELNTTPEHAEKLAQAVYGYTGSDYRAIVRAQRNKDTSNPAYKQGLEVEEFIKRSPKWAGGTTYRGTALTPEQYDEVTKIGAQRRLKSLESFSSKQIITGNFIKSSKARPHQVVYVNQTKKSKYGASVTHVSNFGRGEAEVLYPTGTKVQTTKVVKKKDITYVYIKEV